ncbi:hypothetical protein [Streptomyces sp. NPDC051921]|uniref:hypothetical protein n=1 Tax=Streptomyces sp. NPDC051921 TaxID=3155806 RepID=UPI00342C6228
MSEMVRVIPKEQFDVRDTLTSLAYRLNWFLAEVGQPVGVLEDIWELPRSAGSVHYVEDPVVRMSYMVVRAEDSERVAAAIKQGIPSWDLRDVLQALRLSRTVDEKIKNVYLMALAAHEGQGGEVTEALSLVFRDPAEEVRKSAVVASGYVGLAATRELLQESASGDSSARVRENARLMLEALERHP